MRFSERIGKVQGRVNIQIDSMDDELKNGLWNIITLYIVGPMNEDSQFINRSAFHDFFETVWLSFFKEPIDQIPKFTDDLHKELRKRFYSWDYLQTYDFIDFISSLKRSPFDSIEIMEAFNVILKNEFSGYRFIQGLLAPITNEVEINEVERAIQNAHENNFHGVNIHLNEALKKLSDKHNPDYRNSIKESISAVESICIQITNNPKADLSIVLKKLGSKIPIHGALQQGFKSLYGYTSNGDGIRHAMMGDSTLDQEDAIYMLVTCSSFVNYLISKWNKIYNQ